MDQPKPFLFIFGLFKQNITIFRTIFVGKIPSSIWCWDLNPRPLGRECPPIVTRPGLPPNLQKFCQKILKPILNFFFFYFHDNRQFEERRRFGEEEGQPHGYGIVAGYHDIIDSNKTQKLIEQVSLNLFTCVYQLFSVTFITLFLNGPSTASFSVIFVFSNNRYNFYSK